MHLPSHTPFDARFQASTDALRVGLILKKFKLSEPVARTLADLAFGLRENGPALQAAPLRQGGALMGMRINVYRTQSDWPSNGQERDAVTGRLGPIVDNVHERKKRPSGNTAEAGLRKLQKASAEGNEDAERELGLVLAGGARD